MTRQQKKRLTAQITGLERELAELQAAAEPDAEAIRNAERVLIRRRRELDPDWTPAPPAETPAAA